MEKDAFEIVLCLLGFALTALGGLAIWLLQDLVSSVKALNEKMAVIVVRVDTHEDWLHRLENQRR